MFAPIEHNSPAKLRTMSFPYTYAKIPKSETVL